jgi:methionine-rich copper-binding protein CopC
MKSWKIISLFLVGFGIILLSGCLNPIFDDNATVSDPYLSYPNTVKSTTPPDGTGSVVVDSSIYVQFYRPMYKSKTEAAFEIKPDVAGNFSWPERNVLKFTPTSHFKYDQKYVVTISQTAEDTYRNRLEREYTFSFSTPYEKPYVEKIYPEKGQTNVALGANIEITFSEDMDYTSVYNAFSISPSVAGVFSWKDNTLIFDPNDDLDANTQYQVTISKAAKDLVGNGMEDDFVFSFTTAPKTELEKPYIKYIEVLDNDKLELVMSEKVLQSDAENKNNYTLDGGLILSDAVIGDDGATIYLTTSNQVEGKTYQLGISGIHDLAGNEMDQVTLSFKGIDPPDLEAVNPINSTTIELYFSEKVMTTSAEAVENYFFTPYLEVTSAALKSDGQTVSLSISPQTEDKTYTVIVKNVKDLDGNTIKSNNYLDFQGIP